MISLERSNIEGKLESSRKNVFVALLLLSFLIGASCFSVLNVGLYLDDFTDIKLLHFYPFEMLWQGCSGRQMLLAAFGEHYRPAVTIFYLLDLLCCGINPVLLHLSNLVWHLGASVLVYLVVIRLMQHFRLNNGNIIALWSAMIFAVHPLHTEALCWWAGKIDIIYSVWYLAALLLFLIWKEKQKLLYKILSLALFALSLLCKESAISFPFVLLFICVLEKSNQSIKDRIKLSVKTTLPFFTILTLFWLLRFAILKTLLGSYYALAAGNLPAFLIDQILSFYNWIILFYPLDQSLSSNGNLVCSIILSSIYMFAFAACYKRIQKKDENFFRALILLAGIFLLSIAPSCLIWMPDRTFSTSRLLYLSLFPLSVIFPLMLLSEGPSVAGSSSDGSVDRKQMLLKHGALLLLMLVFCNSSFFYQQRWLRVTAEFTEFKNSLKAKLQSLGKTQKLILVGIPRQIQGIPLFSHFFILQDSLQAPFENNVEWKNLKGLAPNFFGDPQLLNMLQIKRFLKKPDEYQILNCSDGKGNLCLGSVNLKQGSPEMPAPFLKLDCVSQGSRNGKNYSYVRLPEAIAGKQYSIVNVHFDSNLEPNSKIRLLWKTPDMIEFDRHRQMLFVTGRRNTELRLHTAERLNWLNSDHINALELEYENSAVPLYLSLEADDEAALELTADPKFSWESADSVLHSMNGEFSFNFDVSGIPGARGILVEISGPGTELLPASALLAKENESPFAQKKFYVNEKRGNFILKDGLGSSFWHQIRILPVDSEKRPLAAASAPLFIQSIDRTDSQLAKFLLPYNESGASK